MKSLIIFILFFGDFIGHSGGKVYNSEGTYTGVFASSPSINPPSLSYDDGADGTIDKRFAWDQGEGVYFRPHKEDLLNALAKVKFVYLGIIDGHRTWRWEEYERGDHNDPWPIIPTSTGKIVEADPS